MKILYVRGLSEAAREVLKREAEQAHRSLSAQIVTILEDHAKSLHGKTMLEMQAYAREQRVDPFGSQS